MSNKPSITDDLVIDAQKNTVPVVAISPGVMLRNAREAKGLPVADLAVILKISVKKLEALETDRFDLLPDTVFVRALALSVCRALKMDAIPVMASLPQLQAPSIKTDEAGLNATFKTAGEGLKIAPVLQRLNPMGFVILILVLAIAGVFLWPIDPVVNEVASDQNSVDSVQAGEAPRSGSDTARQADKASQTVQAPSITGGDKVLANLPVAPASRVGSEVARVVGISVPASSVSASGLPILGAVLTLKAHGESWVEVVDARGKTQSRKLVTVGEVLQVSGNLPLSVVIGRADAVSVAVHGKPFDLTTRSKDNVARFEVK